MANLVYLLLLAGGAVILPAAAYGAFGDLAVWLPSGALGEAMRDALLHGEIAWRELAVLGGWAAVGAVRRVQDVLVGVTAGCAGSPGRPWSPTSAS